jgi:hypothetical protein
MMIIIFKPEEMNCKKYFLLLLIFACANKATAQTINSVKDMKDKIAAVAPFLAGSKFKTLANLVLNDPGVYNEIWGRVYNSIREKPDQLLFKNLKLKFKTFQGSDSNRTSLGFSYKYDYEINKKKNTDYDRSEFIAKINLGGNIAFKKNLNPMDFQSAKLEIGKNGFWGGTVNKLSADITKELNKINQQLAAIEDENELANSELWSQLTKAMGITNQYHYNFSVTGGWEGSQDFTKSQFTYGGELRFAAKSYADKNLLAQLNILDYPFALIRYVSGTDKSLNPYGAALPLVTIGVDMVKPTQDTIRKQLTGNSNQFARFRFEAGFRTLLLNINNVTLHFNAAYRFFNEINADAAIKKAGLNRSSFFTFSVTGADTYFISYSYGKLPFDRTDNAVYEMGFKFNL